MARELKPQFSLYLHCTPLISIFIVAGDYWFRPSSPTGSPPHTRSCTNHDVSQGRGKGAIFQKVLRWRGIFPEA